MTFILDQVKVISACTIIPIGLPAHPTTHGRKSQGAGGHVPPEFVLQGTAVMFVPQNSAHIT